MIQVICDACKKTTEHDWTGNPIHSTIISHRTDTRGYPKESRMDLCFTCGFNLSIALESLQKKLKKRKVKSK